MSLVETNTPYFASAARPARWRPPVSSVIVGLGVYLLLICAASQLLNDPDSQWHVAVGRWIWENGRVPTTDLFSHTFHGAPWIAKEWGSQLIFFAADRVAGWSGVVVVAAMSIAAAFALLHAWLEQRLRASVALGLTLVAVLLCAPHLLARPHALVLPLMVVWVTQLVAARDAVPPLWLALVIALWANMHGSFPLGLMLAGVLAGEGVLLGSRGTLFTRIRDWAWFLAVATAATLASPYGWRALLVPLQMAGNGEALPFIAEWQPLDFDLNGTLAIALCGLALWALARVPRANLFRIAATLLLAVMMVRHSRFVDQFALLSPVLFASSLAGRFGWEPASDENVPRGLIWLAGLLAIAASVLTVRAAPLPNSKMTPDNALRAAMAQHVSGPVYNAYDFGGFLIAHGVPTFVDGRTDQLFLGGFLPALDKARHDKADGAFAALLARHHVTWALVRSGSTDARHLARMPGWSKLYGDDVAAVYAIGRES